MNERKKLLFTFSAPNSVERVKCVYENAMVQVPNINRRNEAI